MLSFCDNQYFSSSWKDEGHSFLSMEFESFDMDPTQGEVNHVDGQVPKPSVLHDLLGVSSEKEKNKCPKGILTSGRFFTPIRGMGGGWGSWSPDWNG